MKKLKSIVVVDVGTSSVKMAEFSSATGALELMKYGVSSLGELSSDGRDAAVMSALRELMLENGISKGAAIIAVPGQSVFTKFVKCPPVAKEKLQQIVQYEAVQNVPFPIDEVVWDYHALSRDAEEVSVMLVAIKSDLIEGLMHAVEMAGISPKTVDVAPVALFNAVNYNYADSEGCSLVVDVGARSTELIFIEAGRVFMRSIPVAGNALTQQIMRESSMPFADAEALMVQVELGDASIAPTHVEMVKSCTKNILMRLNGEIARSVSFYKSQQNGAAPSQVFLAGGSCKMLGLKGALSEKLGVQVEDLDVFKKVKVSSSLNSASFDRSRAQLGELVGLALRATAESAVEVDLIPKRLLQQRAFKKRQPVMVLTGLLIALTVGVWGAHSAISLSLARQELDGVKTRVDALQKLERPLERIEAETDRMMRYSDRFLELSRDREHWLRVLVAIRESTADGIVLSGLEPMKDSDGQLTGLRVSGFAYLDKVEQRTVVQKYWKRLSDLSIFSSKSKIVKQPSANAFSQEFVIELVFEEPVDA
jgi:type IV pilus assembly protein PilM